MAAEMRFPRSSVGVTRADHAGYEVLITVTKKSIIFWVITPCSSAKARRCSSRKDHAQNI
jgi:hypothetical protein